MIIYLDSDDTLEMYEWLDETDIPPMLGSHWVMVDEPEQLFFSFNDDERAC